MSVQNRLFTLYVDAFRAVMKRHMAIAPQSSIRTELFRAEVVSNEKIRPHLHRITVKSLEFTNFQLSGPDEYVGLILPKPGEKLTMPDPSILNIRAAIKDLPVDLRWYSIRQLHREHNHAIIDIVTHGEEGPGSRWALHAQPGDMIGIRAGSSAYTPTISQQLLIADPSAAPAARAIIESLPDRSNTHVLLIGDTDRIESHFPNKGLASFTHHAEFDARFLSHFPIAELKYAWVCGESNIATGARRTLVELGMDKKSIMFSGYWRKGQARN